MHKLSLPDPRTNYTDYPAIDTCRCPQTAWYSYIQATSPPPSQGTNPHSNDRLSTNLSSPPLRKHQRTLPESSHSQIHHVAPTMSKRFPQFHGTVLHPSIRYLVPKLF